MTELTISASEITEALRKHVTDFNPAVTAEQVGRVVEVGDGIARVSGLPEAKVNELLEFEDGTMGLAMNLDEETIGCVVLGSSTTSKKSRSCAPRDAFCRCTSAMLCSDGSLTLSASPSTARVRSTTPKPAGWRSKRPVSRVVSP